MLEANVLVWAGAGVGTVSFVAGWIAGHWRGCVQTERMLFEAFGIKKKAPGGKPKVPGAGQGGSAYVGGEGSIAIGGKGGDVVRRPGENSRFVRRIGE